MTEQLSALDGFCAYVEDESIERDADVIDLIRRAIDLISVDGTLMRANQEQVHARLLLAVNILACDNSPHLHAAIRVIHGWHATTAQLTSH